MIEKIKNNLPLFAVVLGIFAVVMIFCPAVVIDLDELSGVELVWGIDGLGVVFGMEAMNEEIFEFSFMGLVAYLLPAAGVVLTYIADSKKDKIYWICAAVCFIVGAVLLILMPAFVVAGEKEIRESMEDCLKVGAGAIIGAISCVLAAACLFPTVQASMKATPVAPTAPVANQENTEA